MRAKRSFSSLDDNIKLSWYMNWYLLGYFKFHAGCRQGDSCENGKYCSSSNKCISCSFEVCKSIAEGVKAVAFAYRGTGDKYCRLCNQTELANLKTYKDWSVYKYEGNFDLNVFMNFECDINDVKYIWNE